MSRPQSVRLRLFRLHHRQGRLWVGTFGGVCRLAGERFVLVEELPHPHYVRCIYEDQQGHLWFAVRHKGVFRFDGENYTRFTQADGLCCDDVMAICQDLHAVTFFAGPLPATA